MARSAQPKFTEMSTDDRAKYAYSRLLQKAVGEPVSEVREKPGPWRLLDIPSMPEMLADIFGGQFSDSVLDNINTRLGKLGLRTSVNLGGGKYDHYVRLPDEPVTATTPPSEEPMTEEELRDRVQGLIKRNEALEQENAALKRALAERPEHFVPDDVVALLRGIKGQ